MTAVFQVVANVYALRHFDRPLDKMLFKTLGQLEPTDGGTNEYIYYEGHTQEDDGISVIRHRNNGGNFLSLNGLTRLDLFGVTLGVVNVIVQANYVPFNNASGATFSGGTFLVLNGQNQFEIVNGQSTAVSISDYHRAVIVNLNGTFSAVTDISTRDAVVAYCKRGSIVEVVGARSASAFEQSSLVKTALPVLPPELNVIPENIPISITRDLQGRLTYSTTYDVAIKKATSGLTYYVDVSTGSDSAAGTEGAPLKSIGVAISKTPLARIIMVKGIANNDYDRSYGWASSVTDRELDIIGYGAVTPRLTCVDRFSTWSVYSGSTYTTSRTLVGGVIDYANTDTYGRPQQLTVVSSLAECEATAGTLYYATPNAYIHLFDNRAPDSSVKLVLSQTNGRVVDNSKVYLENLHFTDSYRGFYAEVQTAGKTGGVLYAKDCTFGFSLTENAVNNYGMNSVLQNCIAQYGYKDGFNVHADRTIGVDAIPWAVEINCTGRYCGYDGLEFNNGSTFHDGVIGLRLNGNYHHTHGRVVNDVSENTVSVNIACHAGDSTWSSSARSCFESGQASTGKTKMYCFSCTTSNDGSQTYVKQGVSEMYLFDSPIGMRAQYYGGTNPYFFCR